MNNNFFIPKIILYCKKLRKMNIKEIFINWYENWKLSIHKRMHPNDILTERQKLVFSAFVDGLNDNNCIRFLSVDDGTYDKKYIVSKDYFITGEANLFITLITKGVDGDSKCNIVNHHYLYDENFPMNTTSKMNKMFEKAVIRDRAKMETAMNKNATNSLTQILLDFRGRMKEQTKLMDQSELITDEQTVTIPEQLITQKKKINKQSSEKS